MRHLLKHTLFVFITGLILGVLIHSGYVSLTTRPPTGVRGLRQTTFAKQEYKFINPLLAIDTSERPGLARFGDLKNGLTTLIQQKQKEGKIQTASIYFRDPTTSSWISINPDEKYYPASLLKVPTMMAYFKKSEGDSSVLEERLPYTLPTDHNSKEYIQSPIMLQVGQTYSVSELIQSMIRYSDNNATEILNKNIDPKLVNSVYADLVADPLAYGDDFLTVKAYGLFFQVLYNATYLNRPNSEQVLTLLSQTTFTNGLAHPLPKEIPIAHKFGEYSLESPTGALLKRQLHDCGIVYYPDHPYLLCVMTKGPNFADLQTTIIDFSRVVYDDTVKRYSK